MRTICTGDQNILLLLVGSFSLPMVQLIKIISTTSHFLPGPAHGILRVDQYGTYDVDADGRGAPTRVMFAPVFGFLHDQLSNAVQNEEVLQSI
jgi:hypothetical protein